MRVLCIAVLLAAVPASAQSILPGALEAGPHAVGFRIITVDDASRPTGARVDAAQRDGHRARQLRVHLWYPAVAAGTRVTVNDYIQAGAPATQTHRQDVARMAGLTLTDAEWASYGAYRLTATRDAAPATGRFPLIIGMLRPVSSALPAEHLASHGYVVAYVERQREALVAEGLVREALVMAEHVRDMQVAIARLRTETFVDPVRLGAQGFSGDGLAQVVLAMRHPDVDAVSLFESGWLSPAQVSSFQEMTAYDPLALRAALFYAYSENLGRNSLEHIAELTGMRYAPRSLLYLGEPKMTHLDFVTEGVVLTEVLERRRTARAGLTRIYQATYRYQHTFFDAWVKGDQAARLRLGEVPVARSGGALIELTVLPAIEPAMGRTAFRALVDADLAAALARARAELARDPKAPVFDATWLNTTGFEYFQRNQRDRAVGILQLATEAHPTSANLLDSLSEIQEAMGLREAARASTERALTALATDTTIAAAQRTALTEGLRARLARLK